MFLVAPVIAYQDGTIIEDVTLTPEIRAKLTPLLMYKVMGYDEEDLIPVIITFNENKKASKAKTSVSTIIENFGGEKGFEYKKLKGMSAKIPKEELIKLARDINIEKIFYDRVYPVPKDKTDSDPGIAMQTSVFSIDSDLVWAAGYRGDGIIVAVLDTGINYTHADLGGCSQATFLAGSCTKVPKGYDFYDDDTDPYDWHGHGTHVAGTVAANGGIKGVAPNATLYAAKVCGVSGCPESVMIAALEWAYDNGADIATMSIGGASYINDGSDPVPMVIDRLVEDGMVVTVAAGNEGPGTGTIASPGSSKNAITVGATNDQGTNSTSDDSIISFSCRGPSLFGRLDPDVSAPGVSIYSTAIGGGYTTMSGTSMATPHVAGVAALLLDVDSSLTPEEVRRAMIQNSRTMGEHVFEEGPGMINVSQAAFENASVIIENDQDRIEAIIDPEDHDDFSIDLYNNYSESINFTFSVSDLTDLENGNTITSGNVTLPESEIVDADDSLPADAIEINVPDGTEPGVYGGIMNVTHNGSSYPLVVPIVVSVPQIGSGVVTSSADDDVYAPSYIDEWGDFISFPIRSKYNTAGIDVDLDWTDSGNDLDIYLYGTEFDFGYIIDYSNSVAAYENVSIVGPLTDYYWVNVHNYDLSSTNPETLTLTITEQANINVTPLDVDMNVTMGGTNSTNITVTNDGTPRSIDIEARIYEQKGDYNDTVEIPDEGFCKMYYLSDYSTTYGLDIIDENTMRLDVYMNWSASANDMSLKVFAWMDDGDKVLESGEFGHPFYGSGEFLFMSDSGNYTNESITGFGIWHYIQDSTVDDILVCARTDDNTTTDNLYIEIDTFANNLWSAVTVNPSSPTLSADEELNVTITVDAENLTAGNYSGDIFIDGSPPNYAEFSINVQSNLDTNEPQCNNVSVSPVSYSEYSPLQSYQFNSTCIDNAVVDEVIIEFDGTNYSYLDSEISKDGNDYYLDLDDLSAGTYNYKWFVNDSAGLWNNTTTYIYEINKTNNPVNMTLCSVIGGGGGCVEDDNLTLTYQTNSSVLGESFGTTNLYRNGTLVSNPDERIFGVGVYEYHVNSTGTENYSDNSTGLTFYLTLDQGSTSTTLYLDGTEDDVIYTIGDIANISAILNVSEMIEIETNFTGSTIQLVNGTGAVENITNTSNLNESTVYNITALFSGNVNYTSNSVTYNMAICPVCSEPSEWTACKSKSRNRTSYYCNVTSSYACQNYTETASCGGGGGGGGGSSVTVVEYNISDNLTEGSTVLALGQGSKANFEHNDEQHTATVTQVGSSYTVVKLESEPQEVVIYIGQTEKFDLDGDGKDDFSVKLTGISSGKSTLLFDLIEEVQIMAPPNIPDLPPTEPVIKQEIAEELSVEEDQKEPIDQIPIIIIAGLVVVIGIAVIFKKHFYH